MLYNGVVCQNCHLSGMVTDKARQWSDKGPKKNKKYLSLQCCETTGLKKYHKANAKKQQKAYKTTYKEDKFRTNIGTIMQNLLQCCDSFNFELVDVWNNKSQWSVTPLLVNFTSTVWRKVGDNFFITGKSNIINNITTFLQLIKVTINNVMPGILHFLWDDQAWNLSFLI